MISQIEDDNHINSTQPESQANLVLNCLILGPLYALALGPTTVGGNGPLVPMRINYVKLQNLDSQHHYGAFVFINKPMNPQEYIGYFCFKCMKFPLRIVLGPEISRCKRGS